MPLKLKQGKVEEFGAFTLLRLDGVCPKEALSTPQLLNVPLKLITKISC